MHIYIIILCFRNSVRSLFSSRPKYAIRGTGILGQIASFERRLRGAAGTSLALPCPFRTSTWTQTDAERYKREVAKITHVEEQFRRFWLYFGVCTAWIIYKRWHHFQTVVVTVLNFAVACPRAFVLLDVCRAWTNETRPRGGGSNAPRPAVSVPHLAGIEYVGWARQARSAKILVFWAVYARAILGPWHKQSLNENKVRENIYFQVGVIFKMSSCLVTTARFSWSNFEAFDPLSYECYVVAFRYQISRLNTFVRQFVLFEGGRSLPNDTITPSVRADSSP